MTISKRKVLSITLIFSLILTAVAVFSVSNAAAAPGKPTGVKITKVAYADAGDDIGVSVKGTWKKVKGASGYQVSLSGSNMKGKTYTTTLNKANSEGNFCDVTNPSKAGTIKMKVRAFKIVKEKGKSKIVYGKWSSTVSKSFKWGRGY